MANVFISYSRKDKEAAHRLAEACKVQDIDTWIDWEGIEPTVDWWREIEKGIEEADNFLFLISPDSSISKVCRREIEHAMKNGKRLIPVVVRDVRADESPAELRSLNWIFLRETDEFQNTFEKLTKAIQTDYDWVQTHRRLQVKALEWERSRYENSLLLRGKDMQDAEIELVANSAKEPHATDLQRDYLLKSRQESNRQRRVLISSSIAVAILMAGLAVFGFIQAQLATERADVALGRQLAAQAQTISSKKNAKEFIGILLAVLSMQRYPTIDAAQILQTTTGVPTQARMEHDDRVLSVAFSPDGRYVVSGSDDGTARVWEAGTGKEVSRMTYGGSVYPVVFSPDGRYVLSAGQDQTVRVWEARTGNEVSRMTYEGLVQALAFSPDGKYVVSGGYDNKARVWDAATGDEIAWMIHESVVRSVGFSPDGKYVVSAGDDGTARVWNAATGDEIARMKHESGVNSVAFSPDGRYILSGSGDGTARLWEAATGNEISRMTSASGVYSVAFSPDRKHIVSGGCEDNFNTNFQCVIGTARVWEAATGNEISHMTHDGSVQALAFSSDGRYILSAGGDGTARVWEAGTGKEIARMTHDDIITSAAFSPDGRYAVSGSYDGTVRVWKTEPSQEIARSTITSYVSSVVFSPDGRYVLSGSGDGTGRIWNAATGQEITHATLESHISSVAFSRDGKNVALGGCEDFVELNNLCLAGTIRVRDAATGDEISQMTLEGDVNSIAFSPDGRFVASASEDGTARVWDAATGDEITRMTHDSYVSSVAFSPDGKYVVSASEDGTARVWDAATGVEITRMTHDSYVSSAVFSSDGKYVVSGGCDNSFNISFTCIRGTARVWEETTGKEVSRIIHDGAIGSVAFSPDSKYVVSGSGDGTARVWEAKTGKEIAAVTHDGRVSSVAFNPDSAYVVSASEDGTARVWEAATGKEIARMTHDSYVSSAVFSPDGRYVLSGSGDGTVRIWMWKPDDLIAKACAFLPRNLTRAEWQQYIGDALEYQAICPNLLIEPEVTPTP